MRLFGLSLLLIIALCVVCQAKEWRGIVPLHSTRADVQTLLGTPDPKNGRYVVGNEEAEVFYSKGSCVNGWDVPQDTVILVSVTFKKSQRLSDLNLDLGRYQKANDPLVTSHSHYVNRDEGVQFTVYEGVGSDSGQILTVYYEPTLDDERKLRCVKQLPEAASSNFKFKGGTNGKTSDGAEFSTVIYESSDGKVISAVTETYVTEVKARMALRKKLRSASRVLDRTPKLAAGRKYSRVVARFAHEDSYRLHIMIFWIDGRELHSIGADSLQHAREFEKAFY